MATVSAGLEAICQLVQTRIGIQLDPSRPEELLRLERTRDELGYSDWVSLYRRLARATSGAQPWNAAIRILTNGETYFFRTKPHFDLLREEVLPELIADRRRLGTRELRVWSAGCASGEETYSLLILIRELIPDFSDWVITVIGTDLNRAALQRAELGDYGPWSFRGIDETIRATYFVAKGSRYRVRDDLRAGVAFATFNLASNDWASSQLAAIDILFCRNVTMYFSRETAAAVHRKLVQVLTPGGWLFVGIGEWDSPGFEGLELVTRARTSAYRLTGKAAASPPQDARASVLIERPIAKPSLRPEPPQDWLTEARAAADTGRYDEARDACFRALETDPMNADAHYLLATTYIEDQQNASALESLRKAIYLDSRFALALYDFAHELRRIGEVAASDRALNASLIALRGLAAGTTLRGSWDLTAGDLRAIVERERQRAAV